MIDITNFSYNSQFEEDRWLFEHYPHLFPEKGIFLDVGAGGGEGISNTYGLEKAGWEGLCIDADPANWEELKSKRKTVYCGAVADHNGEVTFYQDIYNPDHSSTIVRTGSEKIITVPCKTIEDLLDEFNIEKIDLFSLDIEGTELEVLQQMDIEKHQPMIVIVEYKSPGLPDLTEPLKEFFVDKPYELVNVTFANLIFIRKENNV